jgi:hypothetical protein
VIVALSEFARGQIVGAVVGLLGVWIGAYARGYWDERRRR